MDAGRHGREALVGTGNARGPVQTGPTETPAPSEESESRAKWVERIKQLTGHKSAAFRVGPELVQLPADDGYAIVAQAWPDIEDYEVKRGMLKAFAFSRHRRILDVLHLGVTDAHLDVQKTALVYLQNYAMRSFADDYPAYFDWRKEFAGQPVEVVLRENCHRLVEKLKKTPGNERAQLAATLSDTTNIGGRKSSYPSKRQYLLEVGLLELMRDWLKDPNTKVVRAALETIGQIKPDGQFLRDVVVPLPTENDKTGNLYALAISIIAESGEDWAFDHLVGLLVQALRDKAETRHPIWPVARGLAELGDHRAVPIMIAVIEADNTYDTVYGIGHYGLGRWLSVTYDESHDGAWWRKWWQRNKTRFPPEIQKLKIPAPADLVKYVDALPKANPGSQAADWLHAGGDERKRYALLSPGPNAQPPVSGYRLLLVLPGGDGGAGFRPFVQRIAQHAVPGYVLAELVAPEWSQDQFKKVVWPTKTNPWPSMKFSTEQFVDAVVDDIAARHKIDPQHIYMLGWSSGGSPCYATSLDPKTKVRGFLIAMSVFKPFHLPPLAQAKHRSYYILHSPEDFIPLAMAEKARDDLRRAGAQAKLITYPGGHGWHGNIYEMIRNGTQWLAEHNVSVQPPATEAASTP